MAVGEWDQHFTVEMIMVVPMATQVHLVLTGLAIELFLPAVMYIAFNVGGHSSL